MAEHVLDDHDGVIHQQSQRQDQGEQSDAVDGLPGDHADEQGNQQNQRNGQGYDAGGARAEENDQQNDNSADSDAEMFHQQVHGLVGLFAVVTRDIDQHVIGNNLAAHRLQLPEYVIRHGYRIGPLALGQSDGYRGDFQILRVFTLEGRAEADAVHSPDFAGAVGNAGNIFQEHRFVVV